MTDLPHPQAIDRDVSQHDFDFLVLFDIDSIPLKQSFLHAVIENIKDEKTLFGIAQNSCLNSTNHVYTGPGYVGLSKELYNAIGRPSFRETPRSDCVEELTWLAEEKGIFF